MDWNTETVNITYASNDRYVGHLAASLYSLLDHNRNIPRMDIYTLPVGMSEAYLERLVGTAGKFCCSSYVVELGNLRERFDYAVDTRGFDTSAMGRLFVLKMLPDNIGKTLYLDCDTTMNGSIHPLYETELGNHLADMVMEPTIYREMKESIGMEEDESYYNSGVLPIDLKAWRNQDVLGQLLEFYRVHQGNLFACDQDIINGVLRGRIMTLSVRYNYFTNYRYFRYRTLVPMYGAHWAAGEDGHRQAGRASIIIHYLGDERPWIAGNHNHFRRLCKYYLDKTPWRGTLKQEGKKLYMRMWWVSNYASLTCPAFRLWISRRSGVRLVNSHRKQKAFGSGK